MPRHRQIFDIAQHHSFFFFFNSVQCVHGIPQPFKRLSQSTQTDLCCFLSSFLSQILENEKANSFGTSDRKEPPIKLTDSASLATSEYKNIPSGEAPKSGCC